ncbi:MAG TPA: transcriptional regulator [Rikenellaceae bacterium]|jgi:predicted transcriptional regulator|nr:MAG: transcriptional regulator [Bacteroidetes bacterium GWE2_40_15]PKP07605.1 MAG: transcriptional regulator [Bacteroidetes bacterium HGW-Bacteroidetes-5]HBZ25391.1 transcriptional regulator [Rikenellaceae bacterium]
MIKLTAKEDEIMAFFWEKGAMHVKDLIELYPDPKPHFNTISTMVRALEAKGLLAHNKFGYTYQYYPVITPGEFGEGKISGAINKYFENSYLDVVSTFVKRDKIQLEELKKLIEEIENAKKNMK